jgi:diguanylate cyclase (GGDEF)-like protein
MENKILNNELSYSFNPGESPESRIERLAKINSKLLSLIGVTSIIVSHLDINEVLKSILEQTKVLMECRQSSVLLVDPNTDQLYFAYLANKEEEEVLKNIRLNKGEGIAGAVWEKSKSILVEDAVKDARFSNKADKKLLNITKTLIASPLVVNGQAIGVMEATNKNDDAQFDKFDLQIFETLSNQAAIAIYNARLYEMAITDGMTKLFIHRYFQSRLTEEFNRSGRYNRNLSLVMFDIDHFKNFNDTYGHQLGDEVLVKTADEIKNSCRNSDIPARYGGEEFAIILPETDKKGAFTQAERIRKRIEESEIVHDGKIIKLTISAGVSSLIDNKPKNPAELIQMADKALYHSKENGRNRVSFYELNHSTSEG